MADYIDRAEAIKAMCRKCTACSVLTDKDDKDFSKAHCAEIRALQELPSAPGWISVKDRLPQVGEKVLTLSKFGHIFDRALQEFSGSCRFYPDGLKPGRDVTHWMPLPEPPKEG